MLGDILDKYQSMPFAKDATTVEFNGATAQNIAGTAAPTFSSLKINGAGVTLAGSVNATVNATLTLLSGNLTTGSNALVVASSGTVSRTGGHVAGNLRKSVATGSNVARTFEVGSGVDYAPMAVSFASVTTAGSLTASTTGSAHPSLSTAGIDQIKNVNRSWTLTNSGPVLGPGG
jgi:fibronectin-binding autotransporter adhesin